MLKVKGLVKRFNRGASEIAALNGVNLHLKPGEFVTVIGSNGAGKSTLLNAIAGVYPVDCGHIILDDEEITHRPEHRRACYLGRVFQDPAAGTAANMTIEENLSLAITKGTQRGLRRGLHQRQRKLFQEKLRVLDLGLENRLNDKVGLLSGGQRQALSLLMAVLVKPKLLLLDEHTAALDPKTATHILKLTEELIKQSNLTALMVTHNLEQALRVGSRTIMMHEGQIILDISGPKRTVMKVPDLLEQFNKVRGTDFVDDRALLA